MSKNICALVVLLLIDLTVGANSNSIKNSAWIISSPEPGIIVGNDDSADIKIKRGKPQTPPILVPESLEFFKQPLCQPVTTRVTLVNSNSRQVLKIASLSSDNDDVHGTWFENWELQPGQNTTFEVIFLPHQIGLSQSNLMISTNQGEINYPVKGNAIENPYYLRPFVTGRVFVGMKMTQPIIMFNPNPEPIQITEIYSSHPEIEIDLSASQAAQKTALNKGRAYNVSESALAIDDDDGDSTVPLSIWTIPPFKRKVIASAIVVGSSSGNINGFISIETNSSHDTSIIPVQVDVSMELGLFFGPGESLHFGTLSPSDPTRHRPLNVIFRGQQDQEATILDIRVTSCHHSVRSERDCPGVSVRPRSDVTTLKPFSWTRIGTISMSSIRHLDLTGYYTGFVTVDYTINSQDTLTLQIPIGVHFVHGHLELPALDAAFLIDSSPHQVQTREVVLRNRYNFPIKIKAVGVPESVSHMFQVPEFKSGVIPPGGNTSIALSFQAANATSTVRSHLVLATNHSEAAFRIPIFSYNGRLKYMVGDGLSGPDEVQFGTVPADELRTTMLHILNPNPVRIKLEKYSVNVEGLSVKLHGITPASNMQDLVTYGHTFAKQTIPKASLNLSSKSPYFKVENISTVLDPGHVATFLVYLQHHESGPQKGDISFLSTYGIMHIPVSFTGTQKRIVLSPTSFIFKPVLPRQVIKTRDLGIELPTEKRSLGDVEPQSLFLRPDERQITFRSISTSDARFIFKEDPKMTKGFTAPLHSQVDVGAIHFEHTALDFAKYDEIVPYMTDSFAKADRILPQLTPNDLEEVGRAKKAWRKLKKTGQLNVTAELKVDVLDQQPTKIPMSAVYQRPKLLRTSSVDFPLTQTRTRSYQNISLVNPSSLPVLINAVPLSEYLHDDLLTTIESALGIAGTDMNEARDSTGMFKVIPHDVDEDLVFVDVAKPNLTSFTLPPQSNTSVSVVFEPRKAGSLGSHIFFANNLTLVEVLQVTGKGGKGTFGFPKNQPHVANGSLVLSIDDTMLSPCFDGSTSLMTQEQADFIHYFPFVVVNRGDLPVKVSSLSIAAYGCIHNGFHIDTCEPFELAPKQQHVINIGYKPDYTQTRVQERLVVQLEHYERPLLFSLLATVPADVLPHCFQKLPPPPWGATVQSLVTFASFGIGLLIFMREYLSGSWSKDDADDHEEINGTPRSEEPIVEEPHLDERIIHPEEPKQDVQEPSFVHHPNKKPKRPRKPRFQTRLDPETLEQKLQELEAEKARKLLEQQLESEDSGLDDFADRSSVTSQSDRSYSPFDAQQRQSPMLQSKKSNNSLKRSPAHAKHAKKKHPPRSLDVLKQPGALPPAMDAERIRQQAQELAQSKKDVDNSESMSSRSSVSVPPSETSDLVSSPQSLENSPQVFPVAPLNIAPSPSPRMERRDVLATQSRWNPAPVPFNAPNPQYDPRFHPTTSVTQPSALDQDFSTPLPDPATLWGPMPSDPWTWNPSVPDVSLAAESPTGWQQTDAPFNAPPSYARETSSPTTSPATAPVAPLLPDSHIWSFTSEDPWQQQPEEGSHHDTWTPW